MKQWIQDELGNVGRVMAKKIHQESLKTHRHGGNSNLALSTMLQDMADDEVAKEPPQTYIFNC
jgi:hypothetical protein